MAHELEVIDGQWSYAGRRPGWHNLGYVDEDLDYDTALRKANLADWNVRAEPVIVNVGPDNPDGPNLVPIEDAQVIVRDDPATGEIDPFGGVVGGRYEPVQNEQSFAIAAHLEGLGAKVETAGSIRGGRQVFLSVSLPTSFVLDPDGARDAVNMYLLLASSHDGTLANQAATTGIRVVCANALDFALPRAKRVYKVRHTSTVHERLAEAQAALAMANQYGERLGQEAVALYKTKMRSADFVEVASRAYPKPDEDKKGAVTRWENKIDLLGDLFDGGGDTDYTLDNVRGTAWAGLNALTERIDWHRKARGGDGATLDIARMGLNPAVQTEKNRLRKVTVEWAREKNPSVFDKVPA